MSPFKKKRGYLTHTRAQKKSQILFSFVSKVMSQASRTERDNRLKKLRDSIRSKTKTKAVEVNKDS